LKPRLSEVELFEHFRILQRDRLQRQRAGLAEDNRVHARQARPDACVANEDARAAGTAGGSFLRERQRDARAARARHDENACQTCICGIATRMFIGVMARSNRLKHGLEPHLHPAVIRRITSANRACAESIGRSKGPARCQRKGDAPLTLTYERKLRMRPGGPFEISRWRKPPDRRTHENQPRRGVGMVTHPPPLPGRMFAWP